MISLLSVYITIDYIGYNFSKCILLFILEPEPNVKEHALIFEHSHISSIV